MSESISKNNELENEVSLDMSYFWYSDANFKCLMVSTHKKNWSSNSGKQAWLTQKAEILVDSGTSSVHLNIESFWPHNFLMALSDTQ